MVAYVQVFASINGLRTGHGATGNVSEGLLRLAQDLGRQPAPEWRRFLDRVRPECVQLCAAGYVEFVVVGIVEPFFRVVNLLCCKAIAHLVRILSTRPWRMRRAPRTPSWSTVGTSLFLIVVLETSC